MSITMRNLRDDTYHFVRREIKTIFGISVITTFISILINMLIKPDINIISIIENKQIVNSHAIFDIINNMSIYEKKQLLKYSIFKILEFLISKTFLLGTVITFIMHLSSKEKKITSSLSILFRFLPSLFILNFFITFITQLGFMLFILPGIFLSILLAMSPIILSFNKKNGIIDSIRLSASISLKYIHIIGTSVLLWMLIKFVFTTLLSNINLINKNFIFFILNINLNILFSMLTIYLFRFYMLFCDIRD